MTGKTFKFETRLIQFAGETIFFCKTFPNDGIGKYYSDQIMRSASGAALNYGEAQGCITAKDFIHKMSLVLKELKENAVSLRILEYVKYGEDSKRSW